MPAAATLEDLDRRVTALEYAQNENTQSLKWLISKVARIQAVQDEHTLRLDRLETKVDRLETKVDGLASKVDGLATKFDTLAAKVDALPRILAEMLDERDKKRKG